MSLQKKTARKTVRKKAAPKAPGVDELKFMIDSAFERRAMLTLDEIEGSTRPTVERVISGLETGEFRVAERSEPFGSGFFFRAHQPSLNRMVMLEVFDPPLTSRPGFRQALLDEARRASRFLHPNSRNPCGKRGGWLGRKIVPHRWARNFREVRLPAGRDVPAARAAGQKQRRNQAGQ